VPQFPYLFPDLQEVHGLEKSIDKSRPTVEESSFPNVRKQKIGDGKPPPFDKAVLGDLAVGEISLQL
jgi:hypothetical protein